MAAKELKPLMGPTVVSGPEDMCPLQTLHNDPLVVQLKIATSRVRRIIGRDGKFSGYRHA